VKHTIGHRYEMSRTPVGKGLYATVHAGYDRVKKRKVAVKITANLKRAYNELRVMKNCSSPYLPVLYDFFRHKGKACTVMEYIDGRELWSERNPRGKVSEARCLEIVISILKGLQALHESGYTHRDTKASNILMVDRNPEKIKIIDFNTSKRISSREDLQKDLKSAAKLFLFLANNAEYEDLEGASIKNKKLRPVVSRAFKKRSSGGYRSARQFRKALLPFRQEGR
jgi:serine/threonine protein kinase